MVDDINKHWLIKAKLQAPRQQISTVERPHLIALLEKTQKYGTALIWAPAGFGKTTLLSQWYKKLREKGTHIGWLTLDEGDDDPHLFLTYIIYALVEAGISIGRLELLAEHGLTDMPQRTVLALILETIAGTTKQVTLIFDDYHRVNSASVDKLLNDMIAQRPDNLSLTIGSRTRPNISLSQFIASGQAVELDANSLRFNKEETKAALDFDISDEILTILFEGTEGWAVAVQLARLVMFRDDDNITTIDHFHDKSGHITSYLTDQVMSDLPDYIQNFLVQTAILERFDAPLANAVCGRTDSFEILKKLEPLHALLVPLDDAKTTFRYHHLFADCLQELLRQHLPNSEINSLHTKASLWFEAEDCVGEAVRHARLAGDFDRCASLIELAGGWELILYGGIGYLRNLLRNIPENEVSNYPRIQAAKAYLSMKDGHIAIARAFFDSAQNNPKIADINIVGQPGIGRDLLNVEILLVGYEDFSDDPSKYEKLLEKIAPDDGLSKGILHCVMAINMLGNGQFEGALNSARQAMRAMRIANTVLGLNYCYIHAGLAAFHQGQLRLAEASFWEAKTMAEDNFGSDSGLKSLADILIHALEFWRDGPQNVEKKSFLKAFAYIENYDGWFEIYAAALGVLTSFDHNTSTLNSIERCQNIARNRDIPRLSSLVAGYKLQTACAAGQFEVAAALAPSLEAEFPIACWQKHPHLWQPYQIIASALIAFYSPHDRGHATNIADDLVRCCEYFKAKLHLIPALIDRALLKSFSGNRISGLNDVLSALTIAAPEKIHQPFKRNRQLIPLMRAALKKARLETVDSLTIAFICHCLEDEQNWLTGPDQTPSVSLSPREREVLEELANGYSNKEIARMLDMTGHTVKFHLKNIFQKLGAERRTQAITKAMKANLIAST